MIVGGAATVITLLALAWVKEIVVSFGSIFKADPLSDGTKTATIVAATFTMYCLDFSINAGMSFSSHFASALETNCQFCSASWHQSIHGR